MLHQARRRQAEAHRAPSARGLRAAHPQHPSRLGHGPQVQQRRAALGAARHARVDARRHAAELFRRSAHQRQRSLRTHAHPRTKTPQKVSTEVQLSTRTPLKRGCRSGVPSQRITELVGLPMPLTWRGTRPTKLDGPSRIMGGRPVPPACEQGTAPRRPRSHTRAYQATALAAPPAHKTHGLAPHARSHKTHRLAPHARSHKTHGLAPPARSHKTHGLAPHARSHKTHGLAPHARSPRRAAPGCAPPLPPRIAPPTHAS